MYKIKKRQDFLLFWFLLFILVIVYFCDSKKKIWGSAASIKSPLLCEYSFELERSIDHFDPPFNPEIHKPSWPGKGKFAINIVYQTQKNNIDIQFNIIQNDSLVNSLRFHLDMDEDTGRYVLPEGEKIPTSYFNLASGDMGNESKPPLCLTSSIFGFETWDHLYGCLENEKQITQEFTDSEISESNKPLISPTIYEYKGKREIQLDGEDLVIVSRAEGSMVRYIRDREEDEFKDILFEGDIQRNYSIRISKNDPLVPKSLEYQIVSDFQLVHPKLSAADEDSRILTSDSIRSISENVEQSP